MAEIVITLLAFIAIGEYCLIFFLLGEKNRVENEKNKQIWELEKKVKRMENNSTTINDLKWVNPATGEEVKKEKQGIYDRAK